MKKFLGFLFLIFVLASFVYATTSMYVCEKGTVNLKPIGIDYTCTCIREGGYQHMVCEKNQ